MSAVIFAGPSIRKADLLAACDAVILPPAAMGDIYRAARQRPRAIGLIDGYFEGAPSVWHKEILWAMAEGVEVFGASSMGALRGAELASFGMRGIGDICAGFLSGRLEDDDEVAVEHGPADLDYIALSEPMVNIRATLDRAAARGIVSEDLARSLTSIAKQQFYKERGWQSLLLLAPTFAINGPELDRLAQWLPGNVVDLKRDDAVKMALAMAQFLAAPRKPEPKDFAFEWTVMWDKATRSFMARDVHATADLDMAAAVLEELRLDPDRYSTIRRGAIARRLADDGLTDHAPIEETTMRQEISRFREKHGLMTHASLMSWLKDNGLDAPDFERLIADEIRLDRIAGTGRGLDRYILAELQFAGIYSALARRAREKRELLDRNAGDDPRPGRLQIMQARLWYFESTLGRPVPDDMARYVGDMGFADVEALDGALLRELAFRRLVEDARESIQ
jgi:hypothetical protein